MENESFEYLRKKIKNIFFNENLSLSSIAEAIFFVIGELHDDTCESIRQRVKQELSAFLKTLKEQQGNGNVYNILQTVSFTLGNEKITHGKEKVNLCSINLTNENREEFDKRNVPEILEEDKNKFGYVGGVAREMLRYVVGFKRGKDFHQTVGDIDTMIAVGETQEIKNKYPTFAVDGIKEITEISEEYIGNKMMNDDMTLNQIFVTREKIYYTAQALEDLEKGTTQLVAIGKTFFGPRSYIKDGETIFFPSNIFSRAMRFIIEGKVESIEFSAHNLDKKNLELLHRESEPAVMLRRRNKNSHQQHTYVYMYKLVKILEKLKIIDSVDDIYTIIENKFEERGRNTAIKNKNKTTEEELKTRFFLSKYALITMDGILFEHGYDRIEELIANYDISNLQGTVIKYFHLEQEEVPKDFIVKIQEIEKNYLQ